MRFLLAALLLTLPLAAQTSEPARAAADAPADALLAPAQELVGKATFLRCLCEDSHLSYDEAGNATTPIKKPVDWTLAAINIEKVEHKDAGRIELTGTRTALRYNEYGKIFERRPLKLFTVHIEVVAKDPVQLRAALSNVISVGIDYRLQQATTPMWKRYFNPSLPWPDDEMKGKTIYAPKGTDATYVPAKPVKRSDVQFTSDAMQNRITGNIQFRAIVDTDGTPHRIRLVQPLGFGLDEKAAEALKAWRFSPATKDGQPVVTEMLIEQRIVATAPKPVM